MSVNVISTAGFEVGYQLVIFLRLTLLVCGPFLFQNLDHKYALMKSFASKRHA